MTITISGTTGLAGVDGSAGTPAIQGADTNTGVFFPAADTVSVATNDVIDTDFGVNNSLNQVTMEAVVYDTRNNSGYRAIIQNNVASDDALYIHPNNTAVPMAPQGGHDVPAEVLQAEPVAEVVASSKKSKKVANSK